MFDPIVWADIFAIETPLLETFIRGTVIYLVIFLVLRVAMKRETGGMGINDLLVVVMIVGASKNGISGKYYTVTDGILLVLTVMFWAHIINWLNYHVPWFAHWTSPDPVVLIRNGRIHHQNLRKELVSTEELESQLRVLGVASAAQVKRAYMEPDGKISVVTYEDERSPRTKRRGQNETGE